MSAIATAALLDYQQYYAKGISFEEHNRRFEAEMKAMNGGKYDQYLPQNWQRQSRISRKLKLNQSLTEEINNIQRPLNWLVITEHWCGDASQINPIINKVAEASEGKINLKFVYRDENETLIDAHLTDNRSRSIPILIQLDAQYQLVCSYGPRPEEAQKLVKSILAEGGNYMTPLHSWYSKDKQKSVQEDLVNLLKRAR